MNANSTATLETLADLIERIGNVPLDRVRLHPAPGTATVDDVLNLCDGEPKHLCELVDGVLVEKAMGTSESRLAIRLSFLIQLYLEEHDLGIVTGADGPLRILFNQVRLPDVAFISYERIPDDADTKKGIPNWIPNLAVEIISPSNTKREMDRKLDDYFSAGVELVWYVDPATKSVAVYHSPVDVSILTEEHELDGEHILPGLRVSIRDWFERSLRNRPVS